MIAHIIRNFFDWFALTIGIAAMVCLFAFPYEQIGEAIICIAGSLGILYIAYALHLWCFRRANFDWHLMNGHFLRKVICIVILMPFTLIILTKCPLISINIPTELVSEASLLDWNTLPYWGIYYHFIDAGNQHMTTTVGGRMWAAVISVLGIFLLNGLLVSSIIGWIDRRKEQWKNGKIRYKLNQLGKYKYAVVIGSNEIVTSVIKNLFNPPKGGDINYKSEGKNRYVILQTCRNIEEIRTELASYLSPEELKKIIIYKALRNSSRELAHLHIEYCTEIYVLGESSYIDKEETFHDSMNMQCINMIAKQLEKTRDIRKKTKYSARKVCKVMFEYQTTYSILQFSDVSTEIKENLVFIPFNRYESWSRKVMVECSSSSVTDDTINYTPLDGNGIKENEDTHVHLIVIGMSKMGIAMGIQAMHLAHYLNFAKAEVSTEKDREILKNNRRTRITFIDSNADKEMDFFKGRYFNLFNLTKNRFLDKTDLEDADFNLHSFKWKDPMDSINEWSHLSKNGKNFIDLEIEFIKGEIESEQVRKFLTAVSDNSSEWVKSSKLTVAVCLTQTHQAVAASLYMPVPVYDKSQEIWVYQKESADIILNLYKTNETDLRYKKLRPFGMLYGEYMSDRSLYLKALLANSAYELNDLQTINISKKETYTTLRESWKLLSLDKKFSNKYFIDSIPTKLRLLSKESSIEEIGNYLKTYSELLARCEHNRWNIQQLIFGYSPCNKDMDKEFSILNNNCATKKAKHALKKWKEKNNWYKLSPVEKVILKTTDTEYQKLSNGIFDSRKKHYKEGAYRIHPNICEYDHLDTVDSGAKDYDLTLNSSIKKIHQLLNN